MNPEAIIRHLGMKIANLEIEDSRKQGVIEGLAQENAELRARLAEHEQEDADGEAETSPGGGGSPGSEEAPERGPDAAEAAEHEPQEVDDENSGDYRGMTKRSEQRAALRPVD